MRDCVVLPGSWGSCSSWGRGEVVTEESRRASGKTFMAALQLSDCPDQQWEILLVTGLGSLGPGLATAQLTFYLSWECFLEQANLPPLNLHPPAGNHSYARYSTHPPQRDNPLRLENLSVLFLHNLFSTESPQWSWLFSWPKTWAPECYQELCDRDKDQVYSFVFEGL